MQKIYNSGRDDTNANTMIVVQAVNQYSSRLNRPKISGQKQRDSVAGTRKQKHCASAKCAQGILI